MRLLVIAAVLFVAACVSEETQPIEQHNVGKTAIELCGEPPAPPTLDLTYMTIDGELRATMPDKNMQEMQFFMGINALWASCVRGID